jgi:para-aminobenzoate synthetase component 1
VTTLPVVKLIPFRDPAAAFAPLAARPMAVLLDSALPSAQGRFSYISADPFRVIRCTPSPWTTTVDGEKRGGDPFAVLAEEMARFSTTPMTEPSPFMGGAIGFFAYELGGVLERLPAPKNQVLPADMIVGLYDTIAVFDLERREAWVIAHGFPETEPVRRQRRAEARAHHLAAALGFDPLTVPSAPGGTWRAETSRTAYESRVAAAIEAIRAGDIYQANLTQRYTAEAPTNLTPYALYSRLRALTPAPFGAFINAGEGMHILSASPERFMMSDAEGRVETRPIKGTRPRRATAAADQAMARELENSAKDRAENLMIVDLLRNDLARVCVPGSVTVPMLCGLETFPAVHHLVSVVTGQLRPGVSAVDLLRATFPGGSITGAPKIKAMEIIHAIEPTARGPYCGAIAWLGFDGAMDSSIVIRTLVQNGTTIMAQAGGGIVAESDPAREYEESVTKVKPLLAVLNGENPP